MRKDYVARFLLGIALLGSSVMGYGMESNEVIGKQKGGIQAPDKLEQGEYRVSKGAFKECLKHFLECKKYTPNGRPKGILSSLLKSVFTPKQLKDRQSFGYKVNDHYKKHFEADSPTIKRALVKDYQDTEEWLKDDAECWLEKAKTFWKKNVPAEDFLNFFKENPKELSGFLNVLSQEKDSNQELPKHLKKLQGTKNGVFNEKDKDQCAQRLSEVVLEFLASENKDKNDSMRCKLYDRFEKGTNWSYCMAYVDLQAPIGTVHFCHPDRVIERDLVVQEQATNILVMVFCKDSNKSTNVYLKHAYPYLGRGVFLKEDPINDLEGQLGNLSLEKQLEEGDKMCKGFFGVKLGKQSQVQEQGKKNIFSKSQSNEQQGQNQ
jgi:flavodoxin